MTEKQETHTPSWTTGDIIDLEYFFHLDRHADEKDLLERDRTLYVRHIAPGLKASPPPSDSINSSIMHAWLEYRRKNECGTAGGAVLPGETFDQGYRFVRILSILAGIFFGFGAAAAVLQYTGTRPVNVSYFLGGLVLPQMILVLVLIIMFLPRGSQRGRSSSPVYGFLRTVLASAAGRIARLAMKSFGAEKKESFTSAMALITGNAVRHRAVFSLPVFILAQVFAVCFNIGVLSATLLRVAGTDLAFGWQSTLRLSPELVHRITAIVATPWRWMVPPGLACPSPDQIEGSRIILKEGIHQLATPDLIAWWPFLCFCILFYGLLPRIALLFAGTVLQRKHLLKLDFNDANSDAVITRMAAPVISSGRRGEKQPDQASHIAAPPAETDDRGNALFLTYDVQCMALIPEDLGDGWEINELLEHFPHRFSYKGFDMFSVTLDEEEDEGQVGAIMRKYSDSVLPNIFLILEAWRPPIKQTLDYIRWLRSRVGEHVLIYIGLAGKPAGGPAFPPASDEDYGVWKQAVASLKDPYLQLERVRPNNE